MAWTTTATPICPAAGNYAFRRNVDEVAARLRFAGKVLVHALIVVWIITLFN